jgi:hypothetical protein
MSGGGRADVYLGLRRSSINTEGAGEADGEPEKKSLANLIWSTSTHY